MLRHLVFFRFKADVPEEQKADLQESLRALSGRIPDLRGIEVGRDVIRSERSYDLALFSTFDDLPGMQRYQVHPDHQAVGAKVRQLCDSVIAVDYEVSGR